MFFFFQSWRWSWSVKKGSTKGDGLCRRPADRLRTHSRHSVPFAFRVTNISKWFLHLLVTSQSPVFVSVTRFTISAQPLYYFSLVIEFISRHRAAPALCVV